MMPLFLAGTAFATAPLLVCLRRAVPATVVRLTHSVPAYQRSQLFIVTSCQLSSSRAVFASTESLRDWLIMVLF